MKHAWHTPTYKTQAERVAAYMGEPRRVCSNCKAVQTRSTSHAWGRVTGYQWLPLVGRCKV